MVEILLYEAVEVLEGEFLGLELNIVSVSYDMQDAIMGSADLKHLAADTH